MTPEPTVPSAYPPPIPPKKHEDQVARAVLYGLIAYFLLAVMQACGKILSENHSIIEIAFYRNIISVIPLTAFIFFTGRTKLLKTREPVLLFARVITGFLGLITIFWSFALLPMAEATVILMTSVLIAPALAFFFLDEHMGPHRWGAIIIGLIGVAIMVGPTGDFPYIGAIIAFTSACLQAVIQIFLRRLKTENSFTVAYYFMLGGAVISALFLPFVAKMPGPEEWLLFLGVGISGGLAQFFITSAFRLAPAGVISPLNYTGLIWAVIFDILVWHNTPGWAVFAGAAIIIASQGYILHRERVHAKHK
jgi:drug/metabolite transporter (DMT)-like permease